MIISSIIGTLIAIGLVVYFVNKGKKPEAPSHGEETSVSKQPDSEKEIKEMMNQLLQLNIRVRIEGMAMDVLERVESIIDTLQELVPVMNKSYPGNDLTWEVNQSVRDYLPNKVIQPFLNLTQEEQTKLKVQFMESSSMLQSALAEISDVVKNNRVGEFQAKAKFMKVRFAR
ncbi:MAG: hypothetical protein U9R34_02605 [Nanoarchaeota archaeon]|nr:hypothetical protein [Nanoarchaeota archaeon]